MSAASRLSPYLMLVLVGFLPNEIWRWLGLIMARGLNEKSEIVIWSRAVATAILAGVIAKLILFPSGELVTFPLAAARRSRGLRLCGVSRDPPLAAGGRAGRRGGAARGRVFFRPLTCRIIRSFPRKRESSTCERSERIDQAAAIAAASFFACSASASGFSFSLAGGFIGTRPCVG